MLKKEEIPENHNSLLTFNEGDGPQANEKRDQKNLALFAMSDFDSNKGNNGANDGLKR